MGEQLIDWSDLDSLKYSGGFVFYAQGNDTKLLENAGVLVSKSPASLGKTMKLAMQNGNN